MADSKSRSVSNLPAAIQPTVETPTIGTATNVGTGRAYNNGAATVDVTNPRGGRPVLYTATSTPGSFTATSATSPLTVAGLASGTAYTFAVTGTSFDGAVTSASSASNSITATTVPQAPTIGTFTDGGTGTSGTLSFTAGATGGSTITAYKYSTDGVTYTTASGTTSPLSVTGLTPATYTFRLRAANANGDSADSGTVSGTVLQPTAFESIATATGTGSSGTITFSSIPSTYRHLQMRYALKTTGSAVSIQMRVNNETTGTNYQTHYVYGNSANLIADRNVGISFWYMPTVNGIQTSFYSTAYVDFYDYASTSKNKTVSAFGGYDGNGTSGMVVIQSNLWTSTSAIDRIDLFIGSGSFTTDSTVSLYGIKGS